MPLQHGSPASAVTDLPLKKRATIGRDRDNDLILPEASVSRRHALLAEVSRGRWCSAI